MYKLLLTTSATFALVAAGVSTTVGHQPRWNMIPWLPTVVCAIPLITPTNPWACLIATIWLASFAALGLLSVGMFYLPAALLMFIATLYAATHSPASEMLERWEIAATRKSGAVKLNIWIAVSLTVGTSIVWLVRFLLNKPRVHWAAYPLLLAPVASASLPVWWPRAYSAGAAAVLLVAVIFFPITISIGIWYTPALIPMVVAAALVGRTNRR
jgi:hypothetical protein